MFEVESFSSLLCSPIVSRSTKEIRSAMVLFENRYVNVA